MFGRGNVQKVNWQDPNLLSQVFPTIPSNMLDKSDGGRDNSFCSSERRQDEKESWFLSIDTIRT